MSRGELAVFLALVGSVGVGLYQLATSPWGSSSEKPSGEVAPGTTKTPRTGETAMGKTLYPPKTVDDGVTKIKFGTRKD